MTDMDIDMDHVIIFGGQFVFRPAGMGRKDWLEFWERVRDPRVINVDEIVAEAYDEGYMAGQKDAQ